MNKSLNKKTIEKIMIWFLSEKEKTKTQKKEKTNGKSKQ